ncbi:MAG: molecular chaperone DnaJ [Oscillospiraceae bacterium]|nr:molecular chaperone DnaJ [Oscillospiraceae bacterium]
MADKRDFYEVLGLKKGATDDEIKKAYRKAAKENHPDLHPGDAEAEARFKEINEAYEILSDPDKKARYDQFGHAGFDPNFGAGGFGGGWGGGFGGGFGGFGGFEDIINEFMGGGGRSASRNGPARGENIRVGIVLSFEEAAFGCEKEISYTRIEDCASCGGSGAKNGSDVETCSHCGGTGVVRTVRQTILGSMASQEPCPKCGGKGKVIKDPCPDCKGKGKVRRNKRIKVQIPAGIDVGQAVPVRGQGHAGINGGPAGDLFVEVDVMPHVLFERQGNSVYSQFTVTIAQAALGYEAMVPTIDGKVKYKIPAGTQPGTVFRLRGKGIPVINSKARGDHFVTVNVAVPHDLDEEQKELLRKFAQLRGEKLEGGQAETSESERKGPFRKKK